MIYIYPKNGKNLLTILEEISCIGSLEHNYEPFSSLDDKNYFLDDCVNCGLIRLGLKNNSTTEDFKNYLANTDFEKLINKAILDRNIGLLRLVNVN